MFVRFLLKEVTSDVTRYMGQQGKSVSLFVCFVDAIALCTFETFLLTVQVEMFKEYKVVDRSPPSKKMTFTEFTRINGNEVS